MFKKLSSALFKIKAFYKRFALVLGIVIPICLYLFMPGVSVFTTPLSFFGITPKTQTLWIVFNQLMAIALLMFGLKANESLADHPKIKKRKKILLSLKFLNSKLPVFWWLMKMRRIFTKTKTNACM